MTTDALFDSTSKYLPYLTEIRRRLLFLTSIFAIAAAVGFIFYDRILRFVLGIFQIDGINIVFTSPFQYFGLAFNASFLLGIVIIFPLIILQVLLFLKPALRPKEFRSLLALLPLSIILFMVGFSYGLLIMKYTVQIFYQQTSTLGVGNNLDIGNFLSQAITTSTLIGIGFQFPIVIACLLRFKVIPHSVLAKKRVLIYLLGLVVVILLPINDLFIDALLLLPLVLMFELTLILNKIIFKGR